MYYETSDEVAPGSGITLRDYFAAASLTGLMKQIGVSHGKELGKWAYLIADAMLKARESQEEAK